MKPHHAHYFLAALMAASATSQATTILDAKTIASAGSGVSEVRDSASIRHNPAAASVMDDDLNTAFSWTLGLSAFASDDIEDHADAISDAVDELERKSDEGTLQAGDGDALITALEAFNMSHVTFGLDDTISFSIPNGNTSYGVTLGASGTLGAQYMYNANDEQVIKDAETSGSFDETSLQSKVEASGYSNIELGLTAAREVNDLIEGLPHPLDLGATLKVQKIKVYNYVSTIGEYDDQDEFDADEDSLEHNGFNVDIGALTKLNDRVTVGLVVRDLFSKTYSGPDGINYEAKPKFVGGASYDGAWYRLNAELDINPVDGFGAVMDRQDLKLSASLHAGPVAEVRLGYRTDLENNYDDTVHLGLLFGGRNFHAGVGAYYKDESTAGLGLQLGVAF